MRIQGLLPVLASCVAGAGRALIPRWAPLVILGGIGLGAHAGCTARDCAPLCVAAPAGCRYEATVDQCSCGALVCQDAAMGDAAPLRDATAGLHFCVTCPPPRPGCVFVEESCDSCGRLQCPASAECAIECPTPPRGCRYEGEPTCDPRGCGRITCDGPDAGGCEIDCPAPPARCRYAGEPTCFPPSCGVLECPGDGACIVDCPPSPPGCRWQTSCSPPSCGPLLCAADAGTLREAGPPGPIPR